MRLPIITCSTLVDITETHVTRSMVGQDCLERNQQRNWETVLQVLGLRTQPTIIFGPEKHEVLDVSEFHFGEMYQGKHMVWSFQFTSELEGIYVPELLEKDFEQVPMISGLTESAKFILPIFYPHGAIKNIAFTFS